MAKLFIMIPLYLILVLKAEAGIPPEILTIAYESSGESLEGQIAVASVIKTRMKERNMSASEVVWQRKQFASWDKPGVPSQNRLLSDYEIKVAESAWNLSQEGEFNHFYYYKIKPWWSNYASDFKRIGNHIFCKL